MINILYNALHLTGQFSGVQYTVEQLMKEAFSHPAVDIGFEALCPANYRLDGNIQTSQKFTKINIDTSNRWQRIGYEHLFMNNYFQKKEKQILHSPAYIRPWHWNALSVITVHDIIALDYPEYCSRTNREYFRIAMPHSINKADRIIAVSHKVKNDIIRKFPACSSKIKVIYHGIDDIFNAEPATKKCTEVRAKYGLPGKYILFVGNIEPKKNIARLIEAFKNLLKHSDIPHSLVIAGQFAWRYEEVMCIKKQNDVRIIFPGYIEQSDLPALYALADLFVFPSLYEGFGIPPLESMACGTPVIVSNRGALPETTGGCACIVDPLSIDSITSAMLELLQNQTLRNQLIKDGKQHIQQFKWSRTWSETAKLYHSLAYENNV